MTSLASADSAQPILHQRYQLQQQLGKKAGRQTWLAQDLQTQESVVVKLLTFGQEFEWDDLKLFEREAETLRSLSHPAIPRYLDSFELETDYGKGFALVQTYIAAPSLEQHLTAGRSFSEADLRQLAKDLLEILSYLHDRQPAVIHRDIKPSNILLGDRSGNHPGQVYLVDFGSVQTLAAKSGGTITVVGTYGYMPPEQFGGRAVPASDLYSLGATLIYLATGLHPADLPQTDLRLQFEPFANLSPTLIQWLQALTAPSLSQRPASATAALEVLEQQALLAADRRAAKVQPLDSAIVLKRDFQSFTLQLPTTQLVVTSDHRWVVLLVSFLLLSPFLQILFAAAGPVVWVVGLWFLFEAINIVFPGRIRQSKLTIDRQRIIITREVFGIWGFHDTQQLVSSRTYIWKLTLVQADRSKLFVHVGNQQFYFRGALAELRWLGSELSRYLGLPLEEADDHHRPGLGLEDGLDGRD
jgi:serine/threonine protein kinase